MNRQRVQRTSATVANPTPTLLSRSTATLDAPGGISPMLGRRPSYDFAALPLYAPAPPIQRKRQGAPLPHKIKAGIEKLSGRPLDDVRVHYGSPTPARFEADAHTQGSEIHLGPGQERLLPHEAWHVVQQKQGRVRRTTQMSGHAINDDAALENEADRMGDRGSVVGATAAASRLTAVNPSPPVTQLNGKKKKKSQRDAGLNLGNQSESQRIVADLNARNPHTTGSVGGRGSSRAETHAHGNEQSITNATNRAVNQGLISRTDLQPSQIRTQSKEKEKDEAANAVRDEKRQAKKASKDDAIREYWGLDDDEDITSEHRKHYPKES